MSGKWMSQSTLYMFISTITVVNAIFCNGSDPIEVRILNGSLRGTVMKSLHGRQFCAFKRVPYAGPPVGEFRFKAPKPHLPWSGTLNATEDPPPCIQMIGTAQDTVGAEDCLFLNIFTPQLPLQLNTSADFLLPVMVYIPGDNWASSAARNYGPEHLMDHDIVLVVMNYRVGTLGFLSTGDGASPGNFGLKDQVQVLRWVKENIKFFGGDSTNVTIFGHDAGAASVHYHLVSPMSKGLFHRAIAQSGIAFSSLFDLSNSSLWARRLARILGCPLDSSDLLVNCLRASEPEILVKLGNDYNFPVVELSPMIEDAFLPDYPVNLLKKGKFSKVPLIMGTVSSEGSPWAAMTLDNSGELEMWNNNLDNFRYAPTLMKSLDEINCGQGVWEPLLNFYLGERNHTISRQNSEGLVKMFGDWNFYYPLYVATILLSYAGVGPIYLYNFDYKTDLHMYNFSTQFAPYIGTTHGDELFYIFNLINYTSSQNLNEESLTIGTLTKMWTDFAKYGNPTPQAQVQEVVWQAVGKVTQANSTIKYLQMTKAELATGKTIDLYLSENLYSDRIEFWKTLPLEENQLLHNIIKSNALLIEPDSYTVLLALISVTMWQIFNFF